MDVRLGGWNRLKTVTDSTFYKAIAYSESSNSCSFPVHHNRSLVVLRNAEGNTEQVGEAVTL
jgi:hypothetical protein